MKTNYTFKVSILLGIAINLLMLSCIKDTEETPEVIKDIDHLTVPADFKFETTSAVDVKFTSSFSEPYAVVEVYDTDPNNGGAVLASGLLSNGKFEKTIICPKTSTVLYYRLKTNNGLSQFFQAPISGGKSEYQYTPSVQARTIEAINYSCNSGCTQTISTSGNYNLNINTGETVCIPEGVTVTGGININGGTLSVCGTASLSTLNLNGNPTIIIGDNGSISSFNFNSNLTVVNYSASYGIPSTIDGTLINYAILSKSGNVTINGSGKLYNHGQITINGSMMNNGLIENNGELTTQSWTQNSSGSFTNNCTARINGSFNQMSQTLVNNSYLFVSSLLQINSGARMSVSSYAFTECNQLNLYGIISQTGTQYARFDIASTCNLYSSSTIQGKVDICDENGIEQNQGTLPNEISYCQSAIPTTDCNPGTADLVATDTDSDGVNDATDVYPEDASRAFVSYFPQKNEGTLAFEDLWPSKGDFDFNDLVVRYHYTLILNAQGLVKEIQYTVRLMAAGGSYKNGFGIEFPVPLNQVSSHTLNPDLTQNFVNLNSNVLEEGQQNAVAILFDNALKSLVHPGNGSTGINTTPLKPYSQPKVFNGILVLNTPMDILSDLPFNPFIFINGNRAKELHLIGSEPTDLADPSFFNTFADASGLGLNYRSDDNLPWAINITDAFDYPIEKIEITQAHLHFYDWAVSSGVNYTNWYKNLQGYRNQNHIYLP